jgi:hypothetical protein
LNAPAGFRRKLHESGSRTDPEYDGHPDDRRAGAPPVDLERDDPAGCRGLEIDSGGAA